MSTLAQVVSEVQPPNSEQSLPKDKCEICGTHTSFGRAPLGLTWSLAWFGRRVLGTFRVCHVPTRFPEERYDSNGFGFSCVTREKVSWISLEDLRADPTAFIETLADSDLKITRSAADQLAELLYRGNGNDWDGYGLWRELNGL